MRRAIALLAASAAAAASCAPEIPQAESATATTTLATVAPPPGGSAITDSVEIRDPSKAATIQICVETTGTEPANSIETAAQLLDAVAGHIDAIGLADGNSPGLFVEVWTTPSDGEGGGGVLTAEVPDAATFVVETGLDDAERTRQLLEQAEERVRAGAADNSLRDLLERLRTVPIPTTSTTDLLRCVSRANAQAAGRDQGRRVVIVSSALAIEAGSSTVRGDLGSVRQILIISSGPQRVERAEAWRPTWISAGAADNRYEYEFDDALGEPLRTAIEGVLQ